MTVEELIEKLKALPQLYPDDDWEFVHKEADRLLLEFINDSRVTEAFKAVPKWYS
jgi:hypothetical protein